MQNRTLSILIGALCIGAAAGIAFLSQESLAQSLTPVAHDSAPAPLAGEDSDAPGTGSIGGHAAEGQFQGDIQGNVAAAEASAAIGEARTDTSGWTSGIIRGDIRLAVSALDRLGAITVVVEEARNSFGATGTRAARMFVPVKRDHGTPTFEVTGVPFSEFPYTVTVHASGLNGGQRMVVIDEQHPLVDDVVLSITPGVPYSILLRDQDSLAHHGVEVRLDPIGLPNGRPRQAGTTDNFGSVVFEDVLAGDYQLTASSGGQQLTEPQRVTVQEVLQMVSTKVQGQGHVVMIPRGLPLDLLVHDSVGYGIPDAKVTATATDRRKLTEIVRNSDPVGRVHFPHLQPGIWQLTIECEPFQRIDMNVTLKADEPPEPRNVRMVRARRR